MGPSGFQSTTSFLGKWEGTILSSSTQRCVLQTASFLRISSSATCSCVSQCNVAADEGILFCWKKWNIEFFLQYESQFLMRIAQGIICKPLNSREATFYEQVDTIPLPPLPIPIFLSSWSNLLGPTRISHIHLWSYSLRSSSIHHGQCNDSSFLSDSWLAARFRSNFSRSGCRQTAWVIPIGYHHHRHHHCHCHHQHHHYCHCEYDPKKSNTWG